VGTNWRLLLGGARQVPAAKAGEGRVDSTPRNPEAETALEQQEDKRVRALSSGIVGIEFQSGFC